MLDTLKISKQLQEAGERPKVADTHALVIANIISSELATKDDLRRTELSLQKEMLEVQLTLQKEIEGVRLTLQKEIAEVRLEIRELEVKMSNKMNVHLRWVAGFLVGQTALLFALIKLLG